MKSILLLTFMLCTQLLPAQLFTELPVAPYFEGVDDGSVTFVDMDGDNDLDVYILGQSDYGFAIAKLYVNDGQGHFTEKIPLSFPVFTSSSIAFADIDGDNDADYVITGYDGSGYPKAYKFANQGDGTFFYSGGLPFVQVGNGSTTFADVDGDTDFDLIISGKNSAGTALTRMYLNDGTGNFSEATGVPFEDVYSSSIAFSDVDGDNDLDVFITGENNSGGGIAKLYTNDGTGNYSEMSGTPFEGVYSSSIAFIDIDGDNDQDVLITGENNSGIRIAKLYTNDGTGSFSEAAGTPFEGVYSGSIAFADVDGDNDPDVIITGQNNASSSVSKLYINDGAGNYAEVSGTHFENVAGSAVAFADVDTDSDSDLIITGRNNLGVRITKFYANDGTGNYAEEAGTPFEGAENPSTAFADVDGDNDLDVLISGVSYGYLHFAKLYKNDGLGNFSEVQGTPFKGAQLGSTSFADIDGDNDQDLLITGRSYTSGSPLIGIARLYKNDGQGNFSEVLDAPFEGVEQSTVAFADIDGDNDQDLLFTGQTNSGAEIAKLYKNDGLGNFSLVPGSPFEGVSFSAIAFADFDGDNDQDVIVSGQTTSGTAIAKLYKNNGTGQFLNIPNQPFTGNIENMTIADVDGDNDLDVLTLGLGSSFTDRFVKLYLNDGTGHFSLSDEAFIGVIYSSAAFADVDGDNDLDVIITGENSSFDETTTFYLNDGMGHFSLVVSTPFKDIAHSSVNFADVDGDNDQDLLLVGLTSAPEYTAKLYLNNSLVSSTIEKFSISGIEFVLYPNPTKAQILNVKITSEKKNLLYIKIFDATGRLISQQPQRLSTGEQNFSFEISNLPKGAYFLQLQDGERQGIRQFIVD